MCGIREWYNLTLSLCIANFPMPFVSPMVLSPFCRPSLCQTSVDCIYIKFSSVLAILFHLLMPIFIPISHFYYALKHVYYSCAIYVDNKKEMGPSKVGQVMKVLLL